MAMGYLRRVLSINTVKAQSLSLLGRLQGLGPGAAAAANRRRQATDLERNWRLQQQAYNLSVRQGYAVHRTGFSKLH